MNQDQLLNQNSSTQTSTLKAKRKAKTKWQWKDYKQEDAGWLGHQLLDWLHNNPDERRLINFLTDIAGISYTKLKSLAAESAQLQDAIDLSYDIIAARHEDDWNNHQGKNINKYAAKFFDLYSPLMQEKAEEKKGQKKNENIVITYDSMYNALLESMAKNKS